MVLTEDINRLFADLLRAQLTEAEWRWLEEKSTASPLELMTAFVAVPRFIGRQTVALSTEQAIELAETATGLSLENWTTVRLSRVFLLTSLSVSDEATYIRHIETLFDTAEMNELVALYSALPMLAFPGKWLFRATEAVRSNVGDVFDALVMHNPYPAKHFHEAAWNQLVLKTIFNDKPIHKIVGLAERNNADLARMLSDFAHERWAAGRAVAPEVWRLTPGFMNDRLLDDMKHLFASKNSDDQKAAALACFHSNYGPALALLDNHENLKNQVGHGQLTWADLEFNDLNTYESK
ncbi:EboA domain-containing protein [Persicitalea jodogahamensis]|uniref:Uncharacterized protein n=1 Tax=Persicitalea jodogahamensis TaxID=402147 RepID=A0A8J3D581_9BACT|nr:EboA domain-containing protein [Persicitalea jodogahamensis]GHB76964.1 hypothetical protein GCM10007390_33700 [Persicitalea jodogahamensis]